jgi:hypothetical protein
MYHCRWKQQSSMTAAAVVEAKDEVLLDAGPVHVYLSPSRAH